MVDNWKKNATATQENFANQFGDRIWDRFEYPSQNDLLRKKIAYALCGSPRNTEEDEGYSDVEKELIKEIQEKCTKCSRQKYSDVYVAFIFVCVRDKGGAYEATLPLIRVRRTDLPDVTSAYFIDHSGRVYESWAEYLKNNTWDGYLICVPNNGKYTTEEDAIFYDQQERGDVLKVLDTASNVTNVVTAISSFVGLGMTFFPPTAPIGGAILGISAAVGTPGAAYGFGRSVGTLVDRASHDQSINPFASSEARGCWLVTAASVLSVGTMGTTKALQSSAQAGNIASRTTRVLITSLHITSISVSGLGVINGFVEVSKKDKVTPLDVLQLTTSVFFFSHTLINFQTASGIIKDAQQSKINSMRADLNDGDGLVFDSLLKGSRDVTGETKVMHGNAKFIKDMQKVTNKSEFFSQFQIRPDGQLHVHSELTIHPKAYVQMSEGHRAEVLELSRKLHNKEITIDTFNSRVFKKFRLKFDQQIERSAQNTGRALGVDNLNQFKVNNEPIFTDITPHEVSRLDQVLKDSCKNYNQDFIALGKELAERQGVQNVPEYAAATEFAARQVDARVKELRNANPNPKRPPGIKAKDHYQKIAIEELRTPSQFDQLNQKFTDLRNSCDPHNKIGNLRFGNSMAAANHYDKHNFFPKVDSQNLTPERYFEIAREMTSGEVTEFVWTQDGSAMCLTFESEKYGAVAIRYDNLANGTSVIATLMSKENNQTIETRMYNETNRID